MWITISYMGFDLNSLGELLRKERSSPSLQVVGEAFYKDLQQLLNEAGEKYPPFSREGENLKNLVTDVFNSREKKLLLFAISFARSGGEVDVENATPDEREFLKGLVETLKDRRASLLERKESRGKKKEAVEVKKTSEEAEGKIERNKGGEMVTLRILQDLPPIAGTDGRTYGAFKAEDVVALPERNAKIFIKHGYGEPIDLAS